MGQRESYTQFTEFFDVTNIKHIQSFVTFHNTGFWPEDFIEELKSHKVKGSSIMYIQACQMIATAYLLRMFEFDEKGNIYSRLDETMWDSFSW